MSAAAPPAPGKLAFVAVWIALAIRIGTQSKKLRP